MDMYVQRTPRCPNVKTIQVHIMFSIISPPISSRGASTSNSRKPRPTAPAIYGHGYYVGVRINKYETKEQARSRGQGNTGMIHPAVVLAGPDVNNRYDIATISTEHPDNPPRAPLNAFHPTTTIRGDISFFQRNVAYGDLRPWVDENTGNTTQSMSQSQVAMLRSQMIMQTPQSPSNGGYFQATASSSMCDRHLSEGSVYPQSVYGQHAPNSIFPHPVHQNVYPSSFPSSNGQSYTPSTSQGMTHGYAAPYKVDASQGRHPASQTMGGPPTYAVQGSTQYWYPPLPSAFIRKSVDDRR